MRISTRLWLGFGVLLAGYVITVGVGVFASMLAANQLRLARQEAVPDVLKLTDVATGFRVALNRYEAAVAEGEPSYLGQAKERMAEAASTLDAIAGRGWTGDRLHGELVDLATVLRTVDATAQVVYGKMARNETDEETKKGAATLAIQTKGLLEREFTLHDQAPAGSGDGPATAAVVAAARGDGSPDAGLMDNARDRVGGIMLAVAESGQKQQIISVAVMAIVLIVAVGMLALIMRRSFTRPLAQLDDQLAGLAGGGGDLTRRLPVTMRRDGKPADELGVVAVTVNRMLGNLQLLVRRISENASKVSGSAGELDGLAQRLATESTAAKASSQASAEGVRAVVADMQSVSAAVQEMSASIAEIARTAQESAQTTRNAVAEAQQAGETVGQLGRASSEIAQVAGLIEGIAGKTNLLALNATIEAARAGEHGRGFAVVAAEVKDLARQTATATSEIRSKVGAIGAGSTAASEAIARMAKAIETIDAAASAIAAAVEEQTATTQEMAQSITAAVDKVNRIGGSVEEATRSAEGTAEIASSTGAAAKSMAAASGELGQAVGQFRT